MKENSFLQICKDYSLFLEANSNIQSVDGIRIESHVESIKDWNVFFTIDEQEAWFVDQRERCSMIVEDIPLNEAREWIVDSKTGNIKHSSGDFFTVHGVRVTNSVTREVGSKGWDQPILTQVGYDGGLLGIIRVKFNGIPHYLLEAKAEPGNYGKVQISPTLQATFSNLSRVHKGNKPRFAEYFENPELKGGKVRYSAWLAEDGGRLHLKRNKGMLVELESFDDADLPESFRWFSLYQIKHLLKYDAWINPHVRGIIAHL